MKLVILEPLGVEQEKLLALAEEKLTDRVEIEAYDTRVTDADALAERTKDADIVVLSNLPFRKEVMERCPKLKMISVAFTGVDHVDMNYCRERVRRIRLRRRGEKRVYPPDGLYGRSLRLLSERADRQVHR